jgi:branched-chain amino acid transport system ATP-binding protein
LRPADDAPVLEARGLQTYYGKSHVLHGVSLSVAAGELVALLGRNGAGKTTTLRSLTGLTPAREGQVRLFGRQTTAWPPDRIAALGVGYVPEGRRVFANLTVDENLRVPLERPGPWTADAVYALFPRLRERSTSLGRQLSGGEQEMLALGRALMINPQLLLLDEPTQGLAPLVAREVFDAVRAMRERGIAVLLVEQNVRAAVGLADRVCVLDDGRVAYEGDASAFGRDEARMRDLAGASAGGWRHSSVECAGGTPPRTPDRPADRPSDAAPRTGTIIPP